MSRKDGGNLLNTVTEKHKKTCTFQPHFSCNEAEHHLLGNMLNPKSGRLLSTPISGGGLFTIPLDISRSKGPIFKIQKAFASTQRDLHF